MAPIAGEHRALPRIPIDLRVHLQEAGNHETVLISHDWSDQSVFLRTRHPLPVGTGVRLFVVTPSHSASQATRIELSGVVVRTVKTEQGAHDRPPGMAIVFHDAPPMLSEVLSHAAQNHAILATPIGALELPEVLIIDSKPHARSAPAHVVEAAGYDVSEAGNVKAALELLDHGLVPDVLIAGSEASDAFTAIAERLAMRKAPARLQLGIALGSQPIKPEDHLDFPLLLLPPSWPIERLGSVMKAFVQRKAALMQVVGDGKLQLH